MNTLKILVIDDESGIRSGISRILQHFKVDYPFMDESISFEISEAATGEEGIDFIRRETPDILLLDNKLPGIQGVEVLEFIKKNQYDILVVMITSFASLELAVKATKDGAYDFIPKPFTPQELRSSIENITKHLFLKRMTKSLQKEGKSIRFQFLSVLSHELKAPLNAVEGYLELMKDRSLGNEIEAYQDMIERSLTRLSGMRQMIMDMLDFTYIESGKKKRELHKINLNLIAQTAADTMQPYAIQRDVKVYINTRTPVWFDGDAEEFEIIFNNFISNAIKYNKKNGRVDCSIVEENDYYEISISDSGIGIEETHINRLFDEFFRIKSSETRNISGTGLGLPIAKKIIDEYNGNISVKSILGEGTTFFIKFPK